MDGDDHIKDVNNSSRKVALITGITGQVRLND